MHKHDTLKLNDSTESCRYERKQVWQLNKRTIVQDVIHNRQHEYKK